MYELVKTALEVPLPFNMIIVLGTLGIGMGTLTAIAGEIRKFATHRLDLDFKRELVDRGIPPDEIEQILQAKVRTGRSK